jgi:hypothetical protein
LFRGPVGEKFQNVRDADAHTANARATVALGGIDRYPFEQRHGGRVRPEAAAVKARALARGPAAGLAGGLAAESTSPSDRRALPASFLVPGPSCGLGGFAANQLAVSFPG